jgi:hypothetical protein
MNIPKSHPQWENLIKGTTTHQFKVVSASLIVSRLGRGYKADPTPQKLSAAIDELVAFFEKFEHLFKEDLERLFG